MLDKFKAFLEDESGATLVEYGLVMSIVSLAGFPVWTYLGVTLTTWFTGLNSDLVVANSTL